MRGLRLIAGALALAAAATFTPQAGAHRGHDAMSVVTLADNGAVTVSHRFEAHDLEPALAEIARPMRRPAWMIPLRLRN